MLKIRPIEKSDLPAISAEPYSVTIDEPGDDLARLTQLLDETGFWQDAAGAVAIDDGGLKGTIQFYRSGPCIHGFELGYVIHDRRYWGKGYASTGLRLLSAKLFTERPRIFRQQLTIACSNTASWKVAERCGFVREGILRASGFGDDPEDSYVYSQTRRDFTNRRD